MTKSSSKWSPPSSPMKLARQEHPSQLDSSDQAQVSPTDQPPDSQAKLKDVIDNVRAIIGGASPLSGVYWLLKAAHARGLISGPKPLVGPDDFIANCQKHEDFSVVLKRACSEEATLEDRQALFSHSVLWTVLPFKSERQFVSEMDSVKSQEIAVVNSWAADFIENAPLGGLIRHISKQLSPRNSVGNIYARYCSIVQSSGMGKSRLLDEFSRSFFMIPINLRPAMSDGFPPADTQVRDFLLGSGEAGIGPQAQLAFSRTCYFLRALFEKTRETIAGFDGSNKAELIKEFRSFMSEGQSMRFAGHNRQDFYTDVVKRARDARANGSDAGTKDLTRSLDNLRKTLANTRSNSAESSISADNPNVFVDIFIAFDEAHSLMAPFDNEDPRSNFTELRRALRELLQCPLWSFFLSTRTTTGKITQFSHPRGLDPSSRINRGTLITPRPYIHLGLDQLTQHRKITKHDTLDYITSLDCVAHLGRPLWGTRYDHGNEEVRKGLVEFAIHKLLGKLEVGKTLTDAQTYAVLSQRLALDIDTPQYLLTSSSPFLLMETMHEQIANHMRVCLAVGSGIESLRGIASSEPILSEAACRVMNDTELGFNLPSALSKVLSGFCINQGAHGELLVAAFFTWARDKVLSTKPEVSPTMLCHYFSVSDLFKSLFCGPSLDSILKSMPSLYPRDDAPHLFEQVFGDAKMHFNHFIKPYEQEVVSRQYLVRFLARGAAALGANCQPGFDAVYPYLYKGTDLDVGKLGFIIVQVKNDSKINRVGICELFRKMDPLGCGLLGKDKSDKSLFTIPIIRIVFFLCGTQGTVELQKYESPSEGATTLDDYGRPLFTSYDYVCSGVSPDILQPVAKSPDTWRALVNARSDWLNFVETPEEKELLCSELPTGGSDTAHYSRWWDDQTP